MATGRIVKVRSTATSTIPVVTTSLWSQAVAGGGRVVSYCQVCGPSGTLLATLYPTGGAVTASFVTGIRSTLDVSFAPSASAYIVPGNELRPFRGFNYGAGQPEVLPLGRFPIQASDTDIDPSQPISLSSVQDRWQWIVQSTFLTPWSTVKGRTVKSEIARCITETGQFSGAQIINTITSNAQATTQTWDQDRNQAIVDMCALVGAEAFCDRYGNVILQDRKAPGTSKVTIAPGNGGRLVDGKISVDTANVFNVVTIIPQNTDPAFVLPTITVKITDPTHPAYPRPGFTTRPYRMDGGGFTSATQMRAAAQKVLTKISAKARTVTVSCLPDVSLSASDSGTVVWPVTYASETLQIGQLTYPLTVADDQQITFVSNRSDEDFNP